MPEGNVLSVVTVGYHQAEQQVNSSVVRAAARAVDIGVAGGCGYVSRVAGVEPAQPCQIAAQLLAGLTDEQQTRQRGADLGQVHYAGQGRQRVAVDYVDGAGAAVGARRADHYVVLPIVVEVGDGYGGADFGTSRSDELKAHAA